MNKCGRLLATAKVLALGGQVSLIKTEAPYNIAGTQVWEGIANVEADLSLAKVPTLDAQYIEPSKDGGWVMQPSN